MQAESAEKANEALRNLSQGIDSIEAGIVDGFKSIGDAMSSQNSNDALTQLSSGLDSLKEEIVDGSIKLVAELKEAGEKYDTISTKLDTLNSISSGILAVEEELDDANSDGGGADVALSLGTIADKINALNLDGLRNINSGLTSMSSKLDSLQNINNGILAVEEELDDSNVNSASHKDALDNIAANIETLNINGLGNIKAGLTSVGDELRNGLNDLGLLHQTSLASLASAIRNAFKLLNLS